MKKLTRRDFTRTAIGTLGGAVLGSTSSLLSGEAAVLQPLQPMSPETLAGRQAPSNPQAASKFSQMLHRIFVNKEFAAKSFGPVRWLNGGKAFTSAEPSVAVVGKKDIVHYETATGKREVLIPASSLTPTGEKSPLAIDDYSFSLDTKRVLIFANARRVWRLKTRGDYWALDRQTGKLKKIGGDAPPSTLMFAKFSPDGSKIAYVRAHDIYVEDLRTGNITRLTHDGSETLINGTSDWVNEEELSIRDGFRWSPDGRSIAYWQFDTSGVHDFTLIYNTGGQYDVVTHIPYPEYGVYPTMLRYPYPQPGTANSAVRIGVVGAAGGSTRWMEVPGDPQNHYIPTMEWAGNSGELVLQHLNRLQNINDVLLADAHSGRVRQIYRDEDSKWVDAMDRVRWFDKGAQFIALSERDGWRHAYAVSRDGKRVRLVTPGAFDVIGVQGVDPQGKWLYYTATPENATQRSLYRISLGASGTPERLTPRNTPGTHAYDISPDYQWAVHTYSAFDAPPVINLIHLPDHRVERVLEDNSALRAKVKPLVNRPTEFFKADLGEGVKLDGLMIKPQNFNPAKKYPVLIHVYGEPAAQAVLDEWGGERAIFHRLLANEGYLIASFDNRGTPAPKGRAWRKIIYGAIGVLSSRDQAAALKALEQARSYVDASRVGVWGWSGGGSNTLNLMFRFPELYKAGMAVAAVPDQRLYDTIYQERYMGLPQDNVKGYQAGSPINFAERLRGKLLIVHGSDDDNVHYQGCQMLINRLIELGKQFDFMEYPGRTHSLSEGPGTQFHLYSLLARYLKDHLPAGPAG